MGSRVQIEDFSLIVRDHCREEDFAHARSIIEADRYRLKALRLIRRRLPVIVDVGGHMGAFGLLAKSLWPDALLIAFEPRPESAQLYRENLDMNGIEGAVVIQCAVAYDPSKRVLIGETHSAGRCKLVADEDAERLQSVLPGHLPRLHILEKDVRCFTLENIFRQFKLDEISLMKLDCKGCEFDLFRQVPVDDTARVKMMLGEYHAPGGFDEFAQDARRAFPHLYFFGDSPRQVAPFWALPSISFAMTYFLGRQLSRLRRNFPSLATSTAH